MTSNESALIMDATATRRRRAIGSFYTPDWIARWMVSRAVSDWDRSTEGAPLRVLDPACGDGAFVLPVLDWLAERTGTLHVRPRKTFLEGEAPAEPREASNLATVNGSAGASPSHLQQSTLEDARGRLAIVREQVFGVDADPQAIEVLRRRVAEWIGDDAAIGREVADVLAANFHCGDALLGPDWTSSGAQPSALSPRLSAIPHPSSLILHPSPLNWPAAFPQVAADGGFDLVIGNPPYHRELNAKEDFDRIAESPLGQRWRRARMDLWHYFLHRGLDLLKPGGRLSFIVNSYWTGSTAAAPMRERLAAETSMEEIVLLGAARLFRGVAGRHMIVRLRKGQEPRAACRVIDLSHATRDEIESAFASRDFHPVPRDARDPAIARVITHEDLWHSGRLRLEADSPRDDQGPHGPTLGELFEVRQGIAENPPFVTKAVAAELDDPALVGRGVFVLTDAEVASLRLNEFERSLLRPYFALPAIGRFSVADRPSHQLLYLTRLTAPTLDGLPHITAHLDRFRDVLSRRREVRSGAKAWWHLHWPREERLFTMPRVLCHQMGHVPRFAYAEQPTFVGFSMHVIVRRDDESAKRSTLSLATLTAILNSPRARQWFEAHAKRRGANLDISGTILKQFPLPAQPHSDLEAALERLAQNWQTDGFPKTLEAENQLDGLVNDFYRGERAPVRSQIRSRRT